MLREADLDAIVAYTEQAGEAFFAVDFSWRLIAINEHASRFAGRTREDLLGRVYWEVVPQREGSNNEQILRAAMAARARVEIEAPSRLRTDRILRGIAIPLENGTAFSFRDVTEERKAEAQRAKALRESEARFRHMADSAPAFIWMTDRHGRVSFANRHFEHVFGRPAAEMNGHGWTQVVVPEDVPVFRSTFLEAFSAREAFRIEVRAIDRHGSTRWLRCDSVPRRDDSGEFLGYTGCGLDITDRKVAEEALRRSEQRVHATQEHAGVGIAETDRDGRYLSVNEAFCRITDYSREELIGRVCWGLTHESFRDNERAQYELTVAGVLNSYTVEKLFMRKSGALRWAWLTSTAIHDEQGRFTSAVRTLIDITEDKQAEERQQLLIHELNHRVKNTLATVQSIVTQTLRTAPSADRARESIEGRLLALSRVHDVLTRENWGRAKLRGTIVEALEPFTAGQKGRIHISGPKLLIPPRLALAIAMAMHELATNAVKYGALSNDTGAVHLSWTVSRIRGTTHLSMCWREQGGPPVKPPSRTGFGSRLIQRSLAQDLGSDVRLRFEPEGVVCAFHIALDTSVESPETTVDPAPGHEAGAYSGLTG